jgi:ABC-type antimicrobial peptide transport system permease subunit
MALGAGRWQVVRAITSRAIAITAIGAAIGSALALGLGRAMESLLFGLVNISLVQLVSLVTVLAAVALFAAYVPARRAARVDPMTALRES